jgi:hypothetical protein
MIPPILLGGKTPDVWENVLSPPSTLKMKTTCIVETPEYFYQRTSSRISEGNNIIFEI